MAKRDHYCQAKISFKVDDWERRYDAFEKVCRNAEQAGGQRPPAGVTVEELTMRNLSEGMRGWCDQAARQMVKELSDDGQNFRRIGKEYTLIIDFKLKRH